MSLSYCSGYGYGCFNFNLSLRRWKWPRLPAPSSSPSRNILYSFLHSIPEQPFVPIVSPKVSLILYLSFLFFCRCFQCQIPPLQLLILVSLSVKEGGSRLLVADRDFDGTSLAVTLLLLVNPRSCCRNKLVLLAVLRGNAVPISQHLCLELFLTSLVSVCLTVDSIVLL